MPKEQEIISIKKSELQEEVQKLKEGGYRLVQMCSTQINDTFEINYSFDKDLAFKDLRILLTSKDEVVPSMSSIFLAAVIYENEMHDLFGINFDGMLLDYKGKFYKTAAKNPFYHPHSKDEGKEGVK